MGNRSSLAGLVEGVAELDLGSGVADSGDLELARELSLSFLLDFLTAFRSS